MSAVDASKGAGSGLVGSGDVQAPAPMRRAVILMTITGLLTPLAGLLSQPILAHALGVSGRGQLAAATAPALMVAAVATLGLPQALTYHLAKNPELTRRSLSWTALLSVLLGVMCAGFAWTGLPLLTGGDPSLRDLIMIAMALTIPALVVGVLRGAASGRQMWNTVAIEKTLYIVLRLTALSLLFVTGQLTVMTALLTTMCAPLVSALVYWRLLLRVPGPEAPSAISSRLVRTLVSYGGRVWLGSVASMVLSRLATLMITPLSSVEELGLYVVAVTISDLPLVVTMSIAGAVFGVGSVQRDSVRTTLTSRVCLLLGAVGCLVLGATLPWWVTLLFGDDFGAAILPTWLLLGAAVIGIPAWIAASGMTAWGKPGGRTLGFVAALSVNLVGLLLLVPPLGAVGAAIAALVGSLAMTVTMVIIGARTMGVPAGDFLLVRRADIVVLAREVQRLRRRKRRV